MCTSFQKFRENDFTEKLALFYSRFLWNQLHEKFRENDFQFLSYCTLTKNKEGESLETLYSPEVEERKKNLNAAKEYIENYFKRKTWIDVYMHSAYTLQKKIPIDLLFNFKY